MDRIRRAERKRLWSSPILWIGIIVILGIELYLLSSKAGGHSEQNDWEAIRNAAQMQLDEWTYTEEGSDAWNTLSEDDKAIILENKKIKDRADKALKAIQEEDWNAEVNYCYEQAKEALEAYQMRPKSEQGERFFYEREADYYQYLMEQKLSPTNENEISSMTDALMRIPDKMSLLLGFFVVFLGVAAVNWEHTKKAWSGFAIGGFSERDIIMAKLTVMIEAVLLLFVGNMIGLLVYTGVRYGIGNWNDPQMLLDSVLQFGRKMAVVTVYEQFMWKLWIYLAYLVFMACFGVLLAVLIRNSIIAFAIVLILGGATYVIENGTLSFISSKHFYIGWLFQYGNTEHIFNGNNLYITALLFPIGAVIFCFIMIWLCSIPVRKKEGEMVVENIEWVAIPFLKGKTPVVVHSERWSEEDLEMLARNWNSKKGKRVKQAPNWMILMPEPPFYPEMSMAGNLSYYETLYGLSKEEKQKRIEEMKLSESLKIKMKKAPSSVYWKVWMLICHLKKPKLLIIDWPLIRSEKEDLNFWKNWLNREVSLGTEVVIVSDGKDEWEAF